MRQKEDSLPYKAEKALQEAVLQVVLEHKRTGEPLIVWKNGKVAKISADEALRERSLQTAQAVKRLLLRRPSEMSEMEWIQKKAKIAIKEAARKVVEEHQRTGRQLHILKNRKVTQLIVAPDVLQGIQVDKQAKAMYIKFSEHRVSRTERINPFTSLDYDKNSGLVGVEIIRIRKGALTNV